MSVFKGTPDFEKIMMENHPLHKTHKLLHKNNNDQHSSHAQEINKEWSACEKYRGETQVSLK